MPIIGSGEYGFPFDMAVRIAVTALGNALLEWRQEDREYFDDRTEGLQNIFFFVWDNSSDKSIIDGKVKTVKNVLREYRKIFGRGRQVVSHCSLQSQKQYLFEVLRYDRDRGYFCIARLIRIMLTGLRFFSVYTYLKDLFGRKNWQRRRFWVEMTVVLKIGMAVFVRIFVGTLQSGGSRSAGALATIHFVLQPRRHRHLSDLPDPYGGYPEAVCQCDPLHAAPPAELCGSVDRGSMFIFSALWERQNVISPGAAAGVYG